MLRFDTKKEFYTVNKHRSALEWDLLYSKCSFGEVYLRNEFNFKNVHGIMNTSGLLQSK